eukprot:TRINITY_DN16115_c0_g1_i1.p1 TRINITY_DN16115_c0_g1~~TRINITY_DN16115_c0_g1_i1.p1  ORF type:complete len:332 (-),score=45.73 TRINITY_DN16115_c0_g1_i1:167-1162(-)
MLSTLCCRRKAKSKRPPNTAIHQQRLRAWRPILTPIPVILLYFLISIIFAAFGIALFVAYAQTVESDEVRYDNKCGIEKTCTLDIKVDEKIEGPVFFYYVIDNHFANYRRFVRSRSDYQLRGETYKYDDLETPCDPRVSRGDSESESQIYLPCGLIARNIFLDNFWSLQYKGKTIPWSKDDIAWEDDVEHKFKNPPDDQPGIRGIADFKDPDFIVWMKVAPFPFYRKLYRKIDQDLEPGTYRLEYENNWVVSPYDGEKSVLLSNTSWIGGKNLMLAICFIVVSGISLLLGILFLLLTLIRRRRLGDPGDLKFDHDFKNGGGSGGVSPPSKE